MEEIVESTASTTGRFNVSRFHFTMTLKKDNTPTKHSPENFEEYLKLLFNETLRLTKEKTLINNLTEYKIGTKIKLNNFKVPACIEFNKPEKLTGDLILNRLSKLFQSGNSEEVNQIDVTYTILAKK